MIKTNLNEVRHWKCYRDLSSCELPSHEFEPLWLFLERKFKLILIAGDQAAMEDENERYFHIRGHSCLNRLTTNCLWNKSPIVCLEFRKLIFKRPANSPKSIIKNVLSLIWRMVKSFKREIDFHSLRASLLRSEKMKTFVNWRSIRVAKCNFSSAETGTSQIYVTF